LRRWKKQSLLMQPKLLNPRPRLARKRELAARLVPPPYRHLHLRPLGWPPTSERVSQGDV
jgi:hypothetical protein